MFKKPYILLKNNLLYVQPFLFWQIIFSAILVFSMEREQLLIPRIIMWTSVLLLFVACLSGWFHINRLAVLSYKENDNELDIAIKSDRNFLKFFNGVGFYFFRVLSGFFVLLVIYSTALFLLYKFCVIHYGIPEFVKEIIQTNQFETREDFLHYLNNISAIDKAVFTKWGITINSFLCFLNFFALLYFTILIFNRKNFIISIFSALRFFIVNLFDIIKIIVFVFILHLFINLTGLFLGENPIAISVFAIAISMYFNYYILLVFCFYHDKTKINCNSGGECIRENEFSNTTCEKP